MNNTPHNHSEEDEPPFEHYESTDAHGTLLEVERVAHNGRVLINILEMKDAENSRGFSRMFITDDMGKIAGIRNALTSALLAGSRADLARTGDKESLLSEVRAVMGRCKTFIDTEGGEDESLLPEVQALLRRLDAKE